jgi:hypothetical protein
MIINNSNFHEIQTLFKNIGISISYKPEKTYLVKMQTGFINLKINISININEIESILKN